MSYSDLEKKVIEPSIRVEIKDEEKFSISSRWLAYYILIKIYAAQRLVEEQYSLMIDFAKSLTKQKVNEPLILKLFKKLCETLPTNYYENHANSAIQRLLEVKSIENNSDTEKIDMNIDFDNEIGKVLNDILAKKDHDFIKEASQYDNNYVIDEIGSEKLFNDLYSSCSREQQAIIDGKDENISSIHNNIDKSTLDYALNTPFSFFQSKNEIAKETNFSNFYKNDSDASSINNLMQK